MQGFLANFLQKVSWSVVHYYLFGDSVIQSLKSGKTRTNGLVPMSRQEKLADLLPWYSLPNLKHDQKRFIRIPLLNGSENEAFRHF